MKKVSVVPSLWLLCGLASKEFYALHNIRVAHFWFYSSVSDTASHKIHFVLFWILQKFRSNWRSFRPILEKNAFNKFNVNNLSFLKLCKIWKSDIVWFFGNPTQHLDFSQETWLAISKTHKKRLMSLSFYSENTFLCIRVLKYKSKNGFYTWLSTSCLT